jgi:hypothetical protein
MSNACICVSFIERRAAHETLKPFDTK